MLKERAIGKSYEGLSKRHGRLNHFIAENSYETE